MTYEIVCWPESQLLMEQPWFHECHLINDDRGVELYGSSAYFVPTNRIEKPIVHNTCFVCGGLMQDSTALQNSLVSSNDFGNDSGERGTTQSRVGQAKVIKVRKCSQCGHSHT